MVDSGYQHAVALKADGTVWAWGLGTSGQLGTGYQTSTTFPALVHEMGYLCPACGTLCHESTDGAPGVGHALLCPNCGQVFDRDSVTGANGAAVAVGQAAGGILENIVGVSAGDGFTLAVDASGNVWAWGHQGARGARHHRPHRPQDRLLPEPG